jgi:2',3'-cyclic-nucleotide 2'-phosphodiesterase (5'-nucleotidase family)
LLDAGNSLAGDQSPARTTQGATSIEAMNRLGYDAMALGGQDLALGLPTLRQRMTEAKFPLLSANAVDAASGQLIAKPYVVKTVGDQRIAIVGLTEITGTPEIHVRDPLATARAIVPEAAGNADVVILLSHAGATVDQQIADSVPGIALIVEGNGPTLPQPRTSPTGGAVMVHADQPAIGHAGRKVGLARIVIGPQGKLESFQWRDVALSPDFADDPAIASWVSQSYKQ